MNEHIIARIREHAEATMDDLVFTEQVKGIDETERARRKAFFEGKLMAHNIDEDVVRSMRYAEGAGAVQDDRSKITTRTTS